MEAANHIRRQRQRQRRSHAAVPQPVAPGHQVWDCGAFRREQVRRVVVAGPLKVKVQLVWGEWHAMGPGKADLLEAIEREGSVPAAARALGMSYRKAWMLIDRMNSAFVGPLVLTRKNGGSARGATVTDLGREVAAAFRAIENEVRAAAQASPHRRRLLDRLARPASAR